MQPSASLLDYVTVDVGSLQAIHDTSPGSGLFVIWFTLYCCTNQGICTILELLYKQTVYMTICDLLFVVLYQNVGKASGHLRECDRGGGEFRAFHQNLKGRQRVWKSHVLGFGWWHLHVQASKHTTMWRVASHQRLAQVDDVLATGQRPPPEALTTHLEHSQPANHKGHGTFPGISHSCLQRSVDGFDPQNNRWLQTGTQMPAASVQDDAPWQCGLSWHPFSIFLLQSLSVERSSAEALATIPAHPL